MGGNGLVDEGEGERRKGSDGRPRYRYGGMTRSNLPPYITLDFDPLPALSLRACQITPDALCSFKCLWDFSEMHKGIV